jgi:GAF domain-containing protein
LRNWTLRHNCRVAEDMLQSLTSFAKTLAGNYDIADVLHELVEAATAMLKLSGAGVSLLEDGHLRYATAVSDDLLALEQRQALRSDGPCIEAIRTRELVRVDDVTDIADRWPGYARQALACGIVSVASVPLVSTNPIGALDLYCDTPHVWTDAELETAGVFADMATGYLHHASALERERRTSEQLQRALDSRVVIEQAKGLLAGERRITPEEAFGQIRRYSNDHNLKLRDVAEAIVNAGLRP